MHRSEVVVEQDRCGLDAGAVAAGLGSRPQVLGHHQVPALEFHETASARQISAGGESAGDGVACWPARGLHGSRKRSTAPLPLEASPLVVIDRGIDRHGMLLEPLPELFARRRPAPIRRHPARGLFHLAQFGVPRR